MNTLELRHIRKSFDGQGVLEDISLSVPAGSVTAIIGPSGSGKSTLLRCATLLETADGGDEEVAHDEPDDEAVHGHPPPSARRPGRGSAMSL